MTVLTDHIHTFGRTMRARRGMHLHKTPDAGRTCRIRDGTKGTCSGTGTPGREAINT